MAITLINNNLAMNALPLDELALMKQFEDPEALKKLSNDDILNFLRAVKDRDTLFTLGITLAQKAPDRFLTLIDFFKVHFVDRLVEMGIFLPQNKFGAFCDRLGIDLCQALDLSEKKMHKNLLLCFKNSRSWQRRAFGEGICHGYSIAFASQEEPTPNANTERRGRFIQAAYELNLATKAKDVEEIGKKIFESPQKYRSVIDLMISALGYSTRKELLDSNNPAKFRIAGSLAYKTHEILAPDMVSFEEHIFARIEKNCSFKEELFLESCLKRLECDSSSLKELIKNSRPTPNLQWGNLSKALQRRQGFTTPDYTPGDGREDINNLTGKLRLLPEGKFILMIYKKEKVAHSLYFSLSPASFFDPNDVNSITFEPRKREFATHEALFQALPKYVKIKYRGEFEKFKILRIEKDKKSQVAANQLLNY